MPEPLTHSGSAADNAFIYFAGGYVGDWQGSVTPVTRHVWRYDTVTDQWQSMLSLPASRAAGQLIRVGRKLHFFGGVDPHKRDRGEHWVLDLRHPTQWVSAASMPNPRNHFGAIETGAKIYAVGGQHNLDENTGNDDEVDAYDVITGTWQKVASLPLPLSHTHNATFASAGKVLTVGGSTTALVSVADVLEYDPLTNTWKKIGDLPTPLSAVVADLVNGHIIVTGGTVQGEVPSRATWINV
jgi:N-acetylneuraminic acid mutarotase